MTKYSTTVLAHDSQYLSIPTMQDNAVYLKFWVSKKSDITKAAMLTYSLCPASVWISWLLVSIELSFISVHSAQFRLLWILVANRWISPHIYAQTNLHQLFLYISSKTMSSNLLNVMFWSPFVLQIFGVKPTEKTGKLKLVTHQACTSFSRE